MPAVLFQTMPPLSPDEYASLEQSIIEHGILVPVLVDENGTVIDGHHRQKIAVENDLRCPVEVRGGLSEADKRTLSISLNVDRRQLTREQRRAIIEASLKADPGLSNREQGRRVGVVDKTVGSVRRELEATAEIPQSDVRVSADGRERPSTQPDRPVSKVTESRKEEVFVDAANRLNAEDAAREIGVALEVMSRFGNSSHRARILTDWWPLGNGAVPPVSRELFNPGQLRQIAVALEQLANEMENQNV